MRATSVLSAGIAKEVKIDSKVVTDFLAELSGASKSGQSKLAANAYQAKSHVVSAFRSVLKMMCEHTEWIDAFEKLATKLPSVDLGKYPGHYIEQMIIDVLQTWVVDLRETDQETGKLRIARHLKGSLTKAAFKIMPTYAAKKTVDHMLTKAAEIMLYYTPFVRAELKALVGKYDVERLGKNFLALKTDAHSSSGCSSSDDGSELEMRHECLGALREEWRTFCMAMLDHVEEVDKHGRPRLLLGLRHPIRLLDSELQFVAAELKKMTQLPLLIDEIGHRIAKELALQGKSFGLEKLELEDLDEQRQCVINECRTLIAAMVTHLVSMLTEVDEHGHSRLFDSLRGLRHPFGLLGSALQLVAADLQKMTKLPLLLDLAEATWSEFKEECFGECSTFRATHTVKVRREYGPDAEEIGELSVGDEIHTVASQEEKGITYVRFRRPGEGGYAWATVASSDGRVLLQEVQGSDRWLQELEAAVSDFFITLRRTDANGRLQVLVDIERDPVATLVALARKPFQLLQEAKHLQDYLLDFAEYMVANCAHFEVGGEQMDLDQRDGFVGAVMAILRQPNTAGSLQLLEELQRVPLDTALKLAVDIFEVVMDLPFVVQLIDEAEDELVAKAVELNNDDSDGVEPTGREIAAFFAWADKDGDGYISFDEACAVVDFLGRDLTEDDDLWTKKGRQGLWEKYMEGCGCDVALGPNRWQLAAAINGDEPFRSRFKNKRKWQEAWSCIMAKVRGKGKSTDEKARAFASKLRGRDEAGKLKALVQLRSVLESLQTHNIVRRLVHVLFFGALGWFAKKHGWALPPARARQLVVKPQFKSGSESVNVCVSACLCTSVPLACVLLARDVFQRGGLSSRCHDGRRCVLGDGGVGKSSLLQRRMNDKFDSEYLPTVFDDYE